MNIARKCIYLFLILSVCLYFLVLGIFGPGGYLYNKSLESLLRSLEYRADRLQSDIENLRIRADQLTMEDGIRDAALSLGYYVEGDTVYMFSTSELQAGETNPVVSVQDHIPYTPLSKIVCLVLSVVISALVSTLVFLLNRNRNEHTGEF